MTHKVAEAGLLHLHLLIGMLARGDASHLVDLGLASLAAHVVLGVLVGLLNISLHIESVARRLGDGETVVQRNTARHGTESDERPPHLVHGLGAAVCAVGKLAGALEGIFETKGDEEHDESGAQLAQALHGEDCSHHRSSPLSRGELRKYVSAVIKGAGAGEETIPQR